MRLTSFLTPLEKHMRLLNRAFVYGCAHRLMFRAIALTLRARLRFAAVFVPVAAICCFSVFGLADPPARIGRLNYLSGSISFRPGDVDDWTPAMINVPLKTGDHLWTDTNAQAEIHVGSTAIRLAPQTAFAFLNIDDLTTQIRLSQGAVNIRLRQLQDSEVFEVDTPNAAVSLLRPGLYRIDVDGFGNTTVTDRLGESEVTASGSAFTVHPRESATITGADTATFDIQAALPPDGWDNWCSGRDQREEQARSVQYVSREMVGYEDLDVYGAWRPVPDYGVVWVPANVPPGWAPYRSGHWIWVEPWGWTWVDDMPWGFAPFHYGRWAFVGGTWVWVPGRPAPRPVYAPALVAFVGGNSWHVSLSIGGGGVAWFPLGPREAYVPAYRVSDTYVRNINVTHVNVTNINVTNVNVVNTTYVNRTIPGAVTAVPQQTFVRAQPVARAAVNVPPQAIASAPIGGMTAAVAPQRESLAAGGGSSAAVSRPPAQAMNRTVVARNTPPPPPVPFAARQSALAATPGQPLDPAKAATLRPNVPAAPQLVRPAVPPTNVQPSTALKPAREGLQPARPISGGVAPAPAARVTTQPTQAVPQAPPAASVPPRGRAPETAVRPSENDRPSNVPRPAPRLEQPKVEQPRPEPRAEQPKPEQRVEPRNEPRPAPNPPAARPPVQNERQERPPAGVRGERPKEQERKAEKSEKSEKSEKQKEEKK